ncbi:putative replication-associated protein [Human fecal virus Jorvi3]|uniref:putative replication-associated protein n=1 Tax=Human fecal virus Jorvi3 TaxID=2017082 RepID=UPI000B5BF5A4|nr:putative replication-associated protein [Human fecal virus Jorvi3]ASH99040.1 putative replication-associated protein [Human fecal virus Jorvi3]
MSTAYCFTLNNPETYLPDFRTHDLSQYTNIRYCIYQLEEGTTPHLQGYLQLSRIQKIINIQKQEFFKHCSFRQANGTPEQNIVYCSKKDETYREGPWIYGTIKQQGKRNDLENMAEDILVNKKTRLEIAKEYPANFMRYPRGINALFDLAIPKRDFKTEVIYIYGSTGTGKSKYAHQFDKNAYTKSFDKWWDQYNGQDTVIMDDYHGELSFNQLLALTDRYECRIEYKGSSLQFNSKYLFIISTRLPDDWYPEISPLRMEEFYRRIDTVIYFTEKEQYQEFHSFSCFKKII